MSLSPIGLFFAAACAVILAIGQVFNKKAVEGQDVAATVFWIRAFAAPLFIVVLLVFILRGAPPVIHPPAQITPEDLQNIPALVNQLKNPANAAVSSIVDGLPATTREQLYHYRSGVDDAKLAKSLSEDFNSPRVISGRLLYEPRNFAGVTLSAATQSVLGKKPHGEGRDYANRLLLEDLFPGTIVSTDSCNLFGLKSVPVSPHLAYGIYLLIEVVLVVWSQWFNSYALKIAPISLCVPFTAFMPIFMLGTAYVVLHELPTAIGLMGIGLIVLGGILMNRKLFAASWKAPIEAIVKEKGSRYMLLSVLIGAVFSPIEKQLILMSDALTTSFAYVIGTLIALWILCRMLRVNTMQVMRQKPVWAVLAGLFEGVMMLAQFIAVMYLPVVITMCIKRAGIVLTVLAGWLIFRERDIGERLIACVAMIGGIAIFYLPLHLGQATVLTGVVLAGLAVAIYLTSNKTRERALAKNPADASVHM